MDHSLEIRVELLPTMSFRTFKTYKMMSTYIALLEILYFDPSHLPGGDNFELTGKPVHVQNLILWPSSHAHRHLDSMICPTESLNNCNKKLISNSKEKKKNKKQEKNQKIASSDVLSKEEEKLQGKTETMSKNLCFLLQGLLLVHGNVQGNFALPGR